MSQVTGLNHITLTVSNLDSSLAFYQQLLGMQAHVRWQRGAYLSAGSLWFCLALGEPAPSGDYSHIAFSVEPEQFAELRSKLLKAQLELWQDNTSEGDSLYILDPDGHRLEIHVGSLKSRLESLKIAGYPGLKWL